MFLWYLWFSWSLVFPILLFSSISLHWLLNKAFLSLLERLILGLVLMGGAILSKSLIQFSVDRRGCCLTWDQTILEIRKTMLTSLKRPYAHIAVCPQPCRSHHQPMALLEIPEHSQASLGQSFVGSLLLSPGSWFTQSFVCVLHESVSPVLCTFCNQIPLSSKVKFPGGSQSFCWRPRLVNLLWVLELS